MKDVGQRGVEVAALKHAVPYLQLFRGKVFVVKLGGAALVDEAAVRGLVGQLAALHVLGIRLAVVHGGGPQSTDLARALGIEPVFVAGRRVTDEQALDVATMALNGTVNTRLLSAARGAGLPALGLSGVDCGLIRARRRPPVAWGENGEMVDYGHVGDVERVEGGVLLRLLDAGFVPIVSPLSADESGRLLNINADSVAAAIAITLAAEKLLIVSDAPGLLERPDDPSSLVSYCDRARLAALHASGSLTKGMLPKAAAIETALAGGVARAHLVSFRVPDALLLEVFTNDGCGTLIVPELAALRPEEKATAEATPSPS